MDVEELEEALGVERNVQFEPVSVDGVAVPVAGRRRRCKPLYVALTIVGVATLVAAAGAMLIILHGLPEPTFAPPVVVGDETIMADKPGGSGSCVAKPTSKRWAVDVAQADAICCHNRQFAEAAGYFAGVGAFMAELEGATALEFFDSVTQRPLFRVPGGRTMQAFIDESKVHGWPSFRDSEVVWENVRALLSGELVSATGTHLGHNLPDMRGANRWCINLLCIAGVAPPIRAQHSGV